MPGATRCLWVLLLSAPSITRCERGPERCDECDMVLVQRGVLLSKLRAADLAEPETSPHGQPALAAVARARQERVKAEHQRHTWRPVQVLLQYARSDIEAFETTRSDELWVLWGFLIVFGVLAVALFACFMLDASRKKLPPSAESFGKGSSKGSGVSRDFPVPKVPRLPRLQRNAYDGDADQRGVGQQPFLAREPTGQSLSSSASSQLGSSVRLAPSSSGGRLAEVHGAFARSYRDGCADPRLSAVSLRAESLCPAPRLPTEREAAEISALFRCGVGAGSKRSLADAVRDGCSTAGGLAGGLASKMAPKAELGCGGPSVPGFMGSCAGGASTGGRRAKDACVNGLVDGDWDCMAPSKAARSKSGAKPPGPSTAAPAPKTSLGSPPATARRAGAKHLCPCLVVPDGMELDFAVRDLISTEKQELSFSIVDLEGEPLSHVIVNEVGAHAGMLVQMLDQTPLAWIRTKAVHDRGSMPEICYPSGEVFCVLVREGSAQGHRYLLRDTEGRNLYSYSGDFKDRAINVVSTSGRLIGDTERCELGVDRSPHFQVRVAPGIDAGLVLCGLLAVCKLEGGAKASIQPGPLSARTAGPITARNHAARLGKQ